MHTLLKSNPKIRRDSAINGKWNQAQNMRWNWAICTELHFQFRSQNLDDVASDFFSWFLKFNYLWFMGIFSIFYSQFNQIFPSNLLFTKNPTSWNFWLQFQMGFVYICQEWLSKIGTAHMCSAAWISSYNCFLTIVYPHVKARFIIKYLPMCTSKHVIYENLYCTCCMLWYVLKNVFR